ncbi:hypothetical protein C0992_000561 [Termitomyces sp. T32_za158]|nr:hypothetical protein C0992_000561 [Termitomyces sp. T32_za158]
MSLGAASSSSPASSASTFIVKVDLFLAHIKELGVGAPQPLVLSELQLLACWETLKSAGVEWKRQGELLAWCQVWQVKHLGAEWLVLFETLLIPSVPDRLLPEEMADILGEESMVVSSAASSGHQQLAAKIASGEADLQRAAGVVIDEAKGKMTVAPAQRHAYKMLKGACNRCWAENNPEGCWFPAGVLPCLCCDSLKKPCMYNGLKSQECSKAVKAVKRTFQKAVLVWRACDFVEAQQAVKATGKAPVISDLGLVLPTGQGVESVSTVVEEEVKAPSSQLKDKGKGKAVTKGDDGEKARKREQPLTGNRGAPCKRQALDEFGAGPSGHRDPSAAPSAGGRLEVVVPAPAWRPVQDWECQLAAAWKVVEEDRAAKAKAEKERKGEEKAKEKEGEEKAAEAPPTGTPAPHVSVRQIPVLTPCVTAEDFTWLGEDLENPVSAFASPSNLEVLIKRELVAVDTEMAELRAHRWNLTRSVEILLCYQEDCEVAIAWQERNNV